MTLPTGRQGEELKRLRAKIKEATGDDPIDSTSNPERGVFVYHFATRFCYGGDFETGPEVMRNTNDVLSRLRQICELAGVNGPHVPGL